MVPRFGVFRAHPGLRRGLEVVGRQGRRCDKQSAHEPAFPNPQAGPLESVQYMNTQCSSGPKVGTEDRWRVGGNCCQPCRAGTGMVASVSIGLLWVQRHHQGHNHPMPPMSPDGTGAGGSLLAAVGCNVTPLTPRCNFIFPHPRPS